MELTEKQEDICKFIQEFIDENNYPPTYTEIKDQFGFKAIGTVQSHISAIEKKGYVKRLKDKARGIVLQEKYFSRNYIPVLGDIKAGLPLMSYENFDGAISIDEIVGKGYDRFALRVDGDSMINAGIYEGDYVIIRKQNVALNGEIVAARIDERVTLKRYYNQRDKIVLKPENDDMMPMIFYKNKVEIEIVGKMVGLFRRY